MILRSITRALSALLTLAACAKPAPPAKPPVAVTVAAAERGPAPYVVVANGVVEPLRSVAVQSQVEGVLTAVHFKEGDEVRAGQPLFDIDPRPYAAQLRQAQAVLARDQAQAENARREAERFGALVQKDYVTKSQADQAAANAAALKAAVDADRANVEAARLDLENAAIRAPVAGKTGSLLVREGNLVRPGSGTPLVVINQMQPILVRFAVGEREFPLVQRYASRGTLKVRATPMQADAAPAGGVLSFVDNGVDTTTGAVTLKARFDNRDRTLWPGQFVRVALELFVDSDAVLVPAQAVLNGQDGSFVFVVDSGDKVAVRPVAAGRAVGARVLIERGLTGGERVVTDGQARLAPGAKVDVRAPAAVPGPDAPEARELAGATSGAAP
jgi:multidrug efflux system membrane fusion protein